MTDLREPPSILITDDDPHFRSALQQVLQPEGFRTLEACDGVEALDILQRVSVDLLLIDYHMPRLTGLETLRRLQQAGLRLPAILISAEADDWLIQQALLAQAFSVLAKTVSPVTIRQTVQQALHRTYGW